MISLRMQCAAKLVAGDGSATLTFMPDYDDQRNEAWRDGTTANATLTLMVGPAVAGGFVEGNPYELRFIGDESGDGAARRAYEAYAAVTDWKNFRGEQMPAWPDLPDRIRQAWAAAAATN